VVVALLNCQHNQYEGVELLKAMELIEKEETEQQQSKALSDEVLISQVPENIAHLYEDSGVCQEVVGDSRRLETMYRNLDEAGANLIKELETYEGLELHGGTEEEK
jgi:hypothetical protein